jgi:TRAP-type C4-dicarboxylate transport system permease small subunit
MRLAVGEALERLDRQLYRAERGFVVFALLAMSVIVFLDVVHRAFAGEENKFVELTVKLGGEALRGPAPIVLAAVCVALGYAAVRSATSARIRPLPALGWSVVGTAVLYGVVRLVVIVLPNGLVWSQPAALVLTLWVGFVGASMCTHENKHLKVEAVKRHIPPALRRWVALVSHLATAAFCLALMWLSIRYVRFNYEEWVATDHRGGLFQGMDAPKWMGFLVLPLAFLTMGVRFLGMAVKGFRGTLVEVDALAGLVDEGTKAAIAEATGQAQPPSEVPTEAMIAVKPIESSSTRRRALPQSEIVTDRHRTDEQAPRAGELATGVDAAPGPDAPPEREPSEDRGTE